MTALLVITGQASPAENAQPGRVLFLGNSVFYYQGGVYQSFEGFCAESGLDCHAVSQLVEPENTHSVEFLGLGRIPLSLPEIAERADSRPDSLWSVRLRRSRGQARWTPHARLD